MSPFDQEAEFEEQSSDGKKDKPSYLDCSEDKESLIFK